MDPKNNTAPEPVISEAEMKVPEEAMRLNHGASNQSFLPVILGVIIVLLVLLLGGLYMWGTTLTPAPLPVEDQMLRPSADENNEPESTTADAQVQALETVSTSNTIEAIEADVESTNLDALDAELDTIDAALDEAIVETP